MNKVHKSLSSFSVFSAIPEHQAMFWYHFLVRSQLSYHVYFQRHCDSQENIDIDNSDQNKYYLFVNIKIVR